MIQLDNLITTNTSYIETNQNQSTSKYDNFENIFDDLLLISDTASQGSNSTSNATTSNFTVESSRNKEFNLTSNSMENMGQKESDQEDLVKIDIVECKFSYNTRPQCSFKTNELGDMAFLYRRNKETMSVCFNRMQYEATIPLNQLIGFCITDDGKILIKPKKDYRPNVNINNFF